MAFGLIIGRLGSYDSRDIAPPEIANAGVTIVLGGFVSYSTMECGLELVGDPGLFCNP